MTLEETVRKIRTDFGDDVIASNRFIGLLKDFKAFDEEEPFVKDVVIRIVTDGYIKEILALKSLSQKKYLSKANDLTYRFCQKYATREDVVLGVINKLSLGLGIIDTMPQKEAKNEKTQSGGLFSNIVNAIAKKPQAAPTAQSTTPMVNIVNNQPSSISNTNPQVSQPSNNTHSQPNKTQSNDIKTLFQKKDTRDWPRVVSDYPIPSDRDDFVQLVSFLKEYSDNDFLGRTCKEKLVECRKRATVIYPDDSQLSYMLCYGDYKKMLERQEHTKQILKRNLNVLWKIGVIAIIIGLIVFGVEKCKRNRAEKARLAEIEAIEYNKAAKIAIDEQYAKLDSALLNLPTPKKSNYEHCVFLVKEIRWWQIDCKGNKQLEKYQGNKRRQILNGVNEYILLLHKIEPHFKSHYDETVYNENPLYVKEVKNYDW